MKHRLIVVTALCSFVLSACATPVATTRNAECPLASSAEEPQLAAVDKRARAGVNTKKSRPTLPSEVASKATLADVLLGRTDNPAEASAEQKDVSDMLQVTSFVTADDEAYLPVKEESPPDDFPSEVTIEKIIQYALDHHPVLRVRRHEIEIAQARLVTAGMIENPQFVMDAETAVYNGPTELTTRLTFTIPFGRKRCYREAAANEAICLAQRELSLETETLLLEAADATIEVLYLQELVGLNSQLAELAAENVRVMEAARGAERGMLRLNDQVRAETKAAEFEDEQLQTRADLSAARLRLCRAIGMPSAGREFQITGRLHATAMPLLPFDVVMEIARQTKPALAVARVAVSESQRLHALAYAEAQPDLTIGPRYQDRLGVDDDMIGARFGMDVPLFDRNQGEILAAAARRRASLAGVDVAELASLGDVAAAYDQLISVRKSLDFHDTRVKELVDRYETLIETPNMKAGLTTSQIAEIRLDLAALRLRHLNLRYQYARLLTRLELFLGRPLLAEGKDGDEADLQPTPAGGLELIPTPEEESMTLPQEPPIAEEPPIEELDVIDPPPATVPHAPFGGFRTTTD